MQRVWNFGKVGVGRSRVLDSRGRVFADFESRVFTLSSFRFLSGFYFVQKSRTILGKKVILKKITIFLIFQMYDNFFCNFQKIILKKKGLKIDLFMYFFGYFWLKW